MEIQALVQNEQNVVDGLIDYIKQNEKVKELSIPPETIMMFAFGFHSNDHFCYNFDDAVKLLEYSRRDNLKVVLTKNFVEGEDYKTLLRSQEAMETGQKEKIMLTVDCFKMLCMQARNEKGKMVRKYFIAMEDIAKRKLVEEGLKVAQLEKRLIRQTTEYTALDINKFDGEPCLYLIHLEENAFKFGISKCVKNRLTTIGFPFKGIVMLWKGTEQSVREIENKIKAYLKFSNLRMETKYKDATTEWFTTDDISKYVLMIQGWFDEIPEVIEENIEGVVTEEEILKNMPEEYLKLQIMREENRKRELELATVKQQPLVFLPYAEEDVPDDTDDVEDNTRDEIPEMEFDDFVQKYITVDVNNFALKGKLRRTAKESTLYRHVASRHVSFHGIMAGVYAAIERIAKLQGVEPIHDENHVRKICLKNTSVEDFLRDECEKEANSKTSVVEFSVRYADYCKRNNWFKLDSPSINKIVAGAGYEITRNKHHKYFVGVVFKTGSVEDFIREKCENDLIVETSHGTLLTAYKLYCEEKDLLPVLNNTFTNRLISAGYTIRTKNKGMKWYKGIKLK